MNIKNKVESSNMIKNLGLNHFSEQIFKKNEIEQVKKFLENNKADYYAIRDKSRVGGIFKLKVSADKVLDEINDYNIFSINISSFN